MCLPCACSAVDCKLANGDEDSVQAYVSDPCRCSCFYHCHKVDGVWTVPVEPQCCPPCTFWSDVNRACIRVLDGCDDVEKVEEVTKNDTEKKRECSVAFHYYVFILYCSIRLKVIVLLLLVLSLLL